MTIFLLFVSKFSFFKKAFRDRDFALLFVIGAFLFVGALVALFVFLLLYNGLLFLQTQSVFGPALTVYVLEAGFALVFVLLVITSVSSGLVIFFGSQELAFLVARPVSFTRLFLYGLLKNYIISSWPVLVLALPAILALGLAYHESIFFYLASVCGIFFGALGAVILGSLVAFAGGYVIPRLTKTYLVASLLAITLIMGYVFSNSLVPVNFQDMFRAELLEEEVVSAVDIERNFAFWPTHVFVNLLRAFLAGTVRPVLINLFIITGAVMGTLFIISAWAGTQYRSLWMKFQEKIFIAGGGSKAKIRRGKELRPPRFLPGETGLIINKDFLALTRNFTNLYSIGFLLFLLFVYAFTVSRVVGQTGDINTNKLALILVFTLAVMGYFSAILSLRFVFPAIAQEGRGAWVTWSSPFPLKKIVRAKMLFYTLIFFVLLGGLFLFSVRYLTADLPLVTLLLGLVFLMVLSINAISLGFGAAFPNFHYTDAERLSTTPAGLATIFASITYISFTAFLMFLFLRNYLEGDLSLITPILISVLSLGVVYVFLRLALNKIRYIG